MELLTWSERDRAKSAILEEAIRMGAGKMMTFLPPYNMLPGR